MSGPILRHVMELVSAPRYPGVRPLEPESTVWVLNASQAVVDRAAFTFRGHGHNVVWIPPSAASSVIDEYVRRRTPDVVVDFGAGEHATSTADWRERFHHTLEVLRAVYPCWAPCTDYGRLRYTALTWQRENESPADLNGLWSGLAKTLPREFPAVIPQVVELPTPDGNDDAVLTPVIDAMENYPWVELVMPRAAPALTPLPVPREVNDCATSRIGSDDTVLMTGGARGIGWRLAVELARRTGCHVLVSGRDDVEILRSQPWARASEVQFEQLRVEAFTERSADQTLPQIRRRLTKQTQVREILANLDAARDEGLNIEYVVCDVTDEQSVRRAVEQAGAKLSAVLHNAGLDMPSRLPDKTQADVETVVAVKLDGFRNLKAALAGHSLKVMCLTGSLTGRYGGMVGQFDYAAANDSLAYAARAAGEDYPVLCVAWPTWNGVGLITNLKAASAYMLPIEAEDGVTAWIREIQGGPSGESAFMGEFATVSAQHLESVPVPVGWTGARRMLSRRYWLGRVVVIEPLVAITSIHVFNPDTAPYAVSAQLGGREAMPITLILELLLQARDGFAMVIPGATHLEDVRIQLAAVVNPPSSPDGPVQTAQLRRTARIRSSGVTVALEVTLDRVDQEDSIPLASATVIVRQDPREHETTPQSGRRWRVTVAGGPGNAGPGVYQWSDVPATVPADAGGHERVFDLVEFWSPALGWTQAVPPFTLLPTTAVEAAMQRVIASPAGKDPGVLRIGAVLLSAPVGDSGIRPAPGTAPSCSVTIHEVSGEHRYELREIRTTDHFESQDDISERQLPEHAHL
ncbi:SDR family NAD(P)-dependent oxidoreductase [Kocuria soli]|uniref:SDR family NAD(P)-dependent oxidoreductase n=1 Tax=Kocuria soli TaxID=2485125 RepID=A0A3N3ZUU7_9MICC|nr:SDR family NAD(P)-dependent oxidoreductase [Kocuria soli]ROZ64249.1 SDR family NAD(P)-dependent oxidoreductase [Kocuria soli]